jgi:hypothetical protein
MYARAVDDAAGHLRQLRREEWEDLGLGALALVAAIAATQALPALALPLFAGGLFVGARGLRALWRRWDMVDRLATDRDAHAIPEVRAYARRETTMARRRSSAALIGSWLREPGSQCSARVSAAADELEALAAELLDDDLELDPVCAVRCRRLLTDLETSPLLNLALPPDDLRSCAIQIRDGFTLRPSA